jgi:hypothetical protein
MLAGYQLHKKFVPCLVDNTDLPFFLRGLPQCDFRRQSGPEPYRQAMSRLLEALERAAPIPSIPLAPEPSPEKAEWLGTIYQAQNAIGDLMNQRNVSGAQRIQVRVDPVMEKLLTQWGDDPDFLSSAGYHKKNAYLLKHWDEVQGGKGPPDDLLEQAALFFFRSLDYQPDDPSALNGLGSVLISHGDLDAAEFFVRRAIEIVKAGGKTYDAAEGDLQLILRLKSQRERPWTR